MTRDPAADHAAGRLVGDPAVGQCLLQFGNTSSGDFGVFEVKRCKTCCPLQALKSNDSSLLLKLLWPFVNPSDDYFRQRLVLLLGNGVFERESTHSPGRCQLAWKGSH